MFKIPNSLPSYKSLLLIGVVFFFVIVTSFAHTATEHTNTCSGGALQSVVCGTLDNAASAVTSKEGGNFLMLLSLFILSATLLSNRPSNQESVLYRLSIQYIPPKYWTFIHRIYDPLTTAFRKGIIHPKLHNTLLS